MSRNDKHPLTTPRSAFAVGILWAVAAGAEAVNPEIFTPWVITLGYVASIALVWLCWAEWRALLAAVKTPHGFKQLPLDFYLVAAVTMVAFTISTMLLIFPHHTSGDGPHISVVESPGSLVAPSGGTNSVINNFGTPPDPNGIYQFSAQVGSGFGAVIDTKGNVISFQETHFTSFIDPSGPLEFKGYLMKCKDAPVAQPNEFVGTLSAVAVGEQCDIVGQK